MKKILSTGIALLYTMGAVAYADAAIIPGNVDDNNKITLTITVDKAETVSRNGMLTIFKQDISADDLKANNVDKSQLFLADIITVPANASEITYTVNMNGEELGMYYAKVTVGGEKAYRSFSYMDKLALDAFLDELAKNTTTDTMYNFFISNKTELMLDIEGEYTDYSTDEKKYALNNVLSRSYGSVQEVKQRFEEGLMLVDLNKSDTIKSSIEDNANIFGIDLLEASQYSKLDDTAKSAVWTELDGIEFKKVEEVKMAFDKSVKDNYTNMILNKIKASTAENVMDILTDEVMAALGLETESSVYPAYIENSEKATEKLSELIAGADWQSSEVAAAKFKESCIVAAYQTLSDYVKYAELINMTKDDVGLSGSYFTWTNSTFCYEVNKLMIASSGSLVDYNSIKTKFEESVRTVSATSSSTSKGGSSSSGGGGGGGVSIKNSSTSSVVSGSFANNTAPEDTEKTEGTGEAYYTDLVGFDWAKESIYNLTKLGIIEGTGNNLYEPSRHMKKEEFSKMLVEALGIEAKDTAMDFEDVSNSAWYYDYIAALYSNEIVSGNSDSVFGAGFDISRENMCVMLSKALDFKGYSLAANTEKINFIDEEHISLYAKTAVENLQLAGVINGVSDDTFEPKTPMNRAMAAVVLERALKLIGKL